MALLWCDGFDHYGTDTNNMLDGAWANVAADNGTANVRLSTTHPATGTHGIRFRQNVGGDTTSIRKVLPAASNKLGVACRVWLDQLPTTNTVVAVAVFLTDNAERGHVNAYIDSNGGFRFYRGHNFDSSDTLGTLIAQSDPDLVVAGAQQHIEIQVYLHDTLGWVRVAVNGTHVYEATGLDTKYDSSDCYSIGHGNTGTPGADWYLDDVFYYDFVGDSAVDTDFVPATDGSGVATNYIGELQVIYCPMDGDTAEADWVPSTGTDEYAMIDEVDPNDADYVSSTTAGDLSEYDITDLPEDITYIRGVQLIGRMSKSDAGTALTQFGMKSVAATEDATERPITVEPTYWWDFMNVDPDSSARWTRESLNAAWFRLTRSA
jgi:hypothetical protein